MKGRISLSDFIADVKADLQKSVDSENPFFIMGEVELEVAFTLDVSGGGKAKLLVVDISTDSKASQTHKVKIKLVPKIFKEIMAGDLSNLIGEQIVHRGDKIYMVEDICSEPPPNEDMGQ
jgi:hypothetical protein